MGTNLRSLFTLAIPLAVGAAGVAWILGLTEKPGNGFVYETAEVSRGTIRKIVSTSGPVRALVTVSIGSQLSGQIDKLNVDFNSEVKAGDELATLDDRTFASRVTQAKADLAAARAALVNQEASLQKAKAILAQAERNKSRQQALARKGFTAAAALETAERDAETARADIAIAEAQIASAKATIEQRQAALRQAQIDLDRTHILSPIDGTVISRTADVGQTVAASLQAPELFKIAGDLRRIRIEANVDEADVGAVDEGNPVTFTVDAYPEREFKGLVTQVRLAATELNNVVTYTVIIEAANEDRQLFPGMTANVQIEAARRENVLRVSGDALRYRPRGGAAATSRAGRTRSAGASRERVERQVAGLREALHLTAEQESALRAGIEDLREEMRQSRENSANAAGGGRRQRESARQAMMQRIEQIVSPLLSDEQRPLLLKWKQDRSQVKVGTVYVLDAAGAIERRMVRTGIADDQFTEVLGGKLAEGDKVIVRAREVKS
jgi:HlyD family secretion protein